MMIRLSILIVYLVILAACWIVFKRKQSKVKDDIRCRIEDLNCQIENFEQEKTNRKTLINTSKNETIN